MDDIRAPRLPGRQARSWVRLAGVVLAMALLLAIAQPALAKSRTVLVDNFDADTLDPAVWHVTNSADPNEPYRCPGSVRGGCLPRNVAVVDDQLRITVPTAPLYSGGQVVSVQRFGYGSFQTRLAAGTSPHALNAMFLYSFATQDEIDVEVTYDGVAHEACGVYPASNRWEVWFTVWRAGVCVAHAEFPLAQATSFHHYAITWRPDAILFSVDGDRLWTAPSLATSDMQLVFNAYEPYWKNPSESNPPPSRMRVDWVRAWPLPGPDERGNGGQHEGD